MASGGWRPIVAAENDKEVEDIGKFAVEEHNKEANAGLSFVRVVGGRTQVVAGVNYDLTISARDMAGVTGTYEAQVWVKAWENFKKLTSFKRLY
ncbi:Cystatin-1 [Acorus gramineus]|uniref:Cysteine proteinase inhibitor n=1 Tax=Acorus gramineus TaxID=55184 RepID=A0AAV9BAQ9_ACOGR|nr:Cystatin-1 [Acorus gramineus]